MKETNRLLDTLSQPVVVASGNQHKISELSSLLGPELQLVSQEEHGIGSVQETGFSFVENALLKARHCAQATGHSVLADDSGLEVDLLNGQPGIYSARFAGEQGDDAANNRKLLELLGSAAPERRGATFHCLLVLMRHARDPMPIIASGSWRGRIATEPDGSSGFGYDPLFFLPEQGCTVAQLLPEEKAQLSHRARAARHLLEALVARAYPD